MKKMEEILEFFYGLNKKQSKAYIKKADKSTLRALRVGYERQCKKTFYED